MPELTCAKPLVGSEAGQPITKLAALNGVCCPIRISPALVMRVDDVVDVGLGDRDLEVLGGVAIDDRDAVVERVDEHATAVLAERGAGGLGPSLRQRNELLGQLGVGAVGEGGAGGDEHDRRVGAVLGLDQQVGGEPLRIGRARRRARRSRSVRAASSWSTPKRCISTWASVTAGEPGPTTLRTAGMLCVPNPRAAMPAGPLTRNTSRWPSLRHTTSTAGSTSPRAARDGRHDGDDPRHAGHDRRNEQLVRHARIARLAGRREQAGRRDRRDLLADRQPRLGLERPVAHARQLLLVERAQVGDRVVDRGVDVVVDARRRRSRRR